jgi:hypothetical protein
VNFDEWRKKRDGVPPTERKTVDDILNSYQGLCYLNVSDVALDGQDRFWLRRSAVIEDRIPSLRASSNWVPVSGFSHGGKVHTDSDVDWDQIQVLPDPDPAEWARVYKIGGSS